MADRYKYSSGRRQPSGERPASLEVTKGAQDLAPEALAATVPSIQHSSEKQEGGQGIRHLGHREYVGGLWRELGRLQFEFLLDQGLKPEHTLLDIACGSLRAGVHFVAYLQAGHYLGIDKEAALIEAGLREELDEEMRRAKRPEFVVSDCFDFSRFTRQPDFSLAQSLFTHLNADDIRMCLRNLRAVVAPGHRFFVTFFEGDGRANPSVSHSHDCFAYTNAEMQSFGDDTGWVPTYIGDWRHPRGQMMMQFALPDLQEATVPAALVEANVAQPGDDGLRKTPIHDVRAFWGHWLARRGER